MTPYWQICKWEELTPAIDAYPNKEGAKSPMDTAAHGKINSSETGCQHSLDLPTDPRVLKKPGWHHPLAKGAVSISSTGMNRTHVPLAVLCQSKQVNTWWTLKPVHLRTLLCWLKIETGRMVSGNAKPSQVPGLGSWQVELAPVGVETQRVFWAFQGPLISARFAGWCSFGKVYSLYWL